MDEIIEYLEKKIQACDELGGMELEKFAFVVTLKKVRKVAMNYTPCCMSEAEQLACDCDRQPLRYNELGACKYCGKQKPSEG